MSGGIVPHMTVPVYLFLQHLSTVESRRFIQWSPVHFFRRTRASAVWGRITSLHCVLQITSVGIVRQAFAIIRSWSGYNPNPNPNSKRCSRIISLSFLHRQRQRRQQQQYNIP